MRLIPKFRFLAQIQSMGTILRLNLIEAMPCLRLSSGFTDVRIQRGDRVSGLTPTLKIHKI